MGTIKNAVYKVDNGTDFDEIHFKTKAAQVFCNDGKTVESQLAEMIPTSQGVWTPYLYNGANGQGAVQKNKGSYWYKVGNIVTCSFDIEVSSYDTAWTGAAMLLKGFPFTPNKSFAETGIISYYYGFKISGTYGVSIYPHVTAAAYWLGRVSASNNENGILWGNHVEQYFIIKGTLSFMI